MGDALQGRRIVVGVAGGIAAYKAAELCSQLQKAGAQVRVAMSNWADRFVAPLTFEAITQHRVYGRIFDEAQSHEMEHISWARWADALVIAPATADLLARMAAGLADDPVAVLYLAFRGPVVVAPAMNTAMLEHPATAANLETLRRRGVLVVETESGPLACGEVGSGRLAAPERIVDFLRALDFSRPAAAPSAPADDSAAPAASPDASGTLAPPSAPPLPPPDDSMAGLTVLITSGPTHEYIDPVRFMTNPSSGKMGAALAREAARRGAKVHLVSGPVAPSSLPAEAATIHRITTAEQMLKTVTELAPGVDLFVFAAAVSDFRLSQKIGQKIKRTGNSIALQLTENPDIAQTIGHSKRENQVTVGFAAETEDLETNALSKLARKRLDAIVANDVANPRIGFERDENEVTVYLRDGGKVHVPRRSKAEVAREVFEIVLPMCRKPAGSQEQRP